MKINPANRTDDDAESTTESNEPTARADGAGADVVEESRVADESGTPAKRSVGAAAESSASGSESSDAAEESSASGDEAADAAEESDAADGGSGTVEPLTITLPDGSESVSEAILSHRQMLTNPTEHDLVSASEVDEVREAVDDLSEEVSDDLRAEMERLDGAVDGVEDRLDRQAEQIAELRDTVTSLAEILGASVEFQTLGEGDDADDGADADADTDEE